MRGQAGDEHGGSPWFKGGVEPRRMARVVDAVGRRASSQSFPPRSGLVQDPLSPVLDGRAVSKRKKPVPEGPCADDGLTASRCGLSGTGFFLFSHHQLRPFNFTDHWLLTTRRMARARPLNECVS